MSKSHCCRQSWVPSDSPCMYELSIITWVNRNGSLDQLHLTTEVQSFMHMAYHTAMLRCYKSNESSIQMNTELHDRMKFCILLMDFGQEIINTQTTHDYDCFPKYCMIIFHQFITMDLRHFFHCNSVDYNSHTSCRYDCYAKSRKFTWKLRNDTILSEHAAEPTMI